MPRGPGPDARMSPARLGRSRVGPFRGEAGGMRGWRTRMATSTPKRSLGRFFTFPDEQRTARMYESLRNIVQAKQNDVQGSGWGVETITHIAQDHSRQLRDPTRACVRCASSGQGGGLGVGTLGTGRVGCGDSLGCHAGGDVSGLRGVGGPAGREKPCMSVHIRRITDAWFTRSNDRNKNGATPFRGSRHLRVPASGSRRTSSQA